MISSLWEDAERFIQSVKLADSIQRDLVSGEQL